MAKTTDTGRSWKLMNPGLPAIYVYQGGGGFVRGAEDVLYAWNDYGGFRSTDSAESWRALPRIADDPNVQYRIDRIYASPLVPGLAAITFKEGLLVSGAGSQAAAGAVPQTAQTSLMLTRNGGFTWDIGPGCLLAGASAGVYRTADRGETWNRIEEGLAMPAVDGVSVTPAAPDVIYIQTSAGLFRSDDAGGQWIPINPELDAEEKIFSLAASPLDDSLLLLSTYAALHLSHDRGDHWKRVLEIAPAWRQSCYITFAPDDPDTFYVTVTGHSPFPAFVYWAEMYRTRDGGQTWATLPIDGDEWASEPVCGPGGLLFIVQAGKLFRSTDHGDSWTSAADLNWYEWQLAGSPSNPSVLYGARDSGVWQSRDLGETWIQIAQFDYGYTVTSLVVDPLDSDRIYVAAGDSVFLVKASERSIRLLARGPSSYMVRMAVMPWRRVLLGAPSLHYEGLYVTGIPPLSDRPHRRR